jgi:hypothetical protein
LTDPVVISDTPDSSGDGEIVYVDETGPSGRMDAADAGLAEIEQLNARARSIQRPQPDRTRSRARKGGQVRGRAVAGGPDDHVGSAVADLDRGAAAAAPYRGPSDWVRRHRNPLLFVAVASLIGATIGFRQWRQNRQELPRVVALGRVDGLAALDEGDFDKAYQLLSRARHAAQSLGDAVEGAAQVHQGAAEAEIFVQLVPDRLEAILDAAGRADPKDWLARFSTLYRGRTIIIDAHVVATPKTSGLSVYELDYQVLPDGEGKLTRVARIDTTGFRLFDATQPAIGSRVTFGARLASFTYDDQTQEWRVGLEPQSGVYLTHPRALEALGWPTFAEPAMKDGGEP